MQKQVIALEATLNSGPAEGSVKSLKAQLREAQAEVSALSDKFGETSVEAANAARKAAELKDRIGDAKALTEAFNPDKKFQAFSTALQGVVGGFTAVQGAQALLGVKSEELEKTLLKVQGAMALSQGLSAITESIDSFKNLKVVAVATFNSIRTAIGTTGIGVLVIALGAIITALMDYAESTDSATEAAKRQKKAEEDLKTSIENTNSEIQNRNSLNDYLLQIELTNAKARGSSLKELRSIEDKYYYQKRLDAQEDLRIADEQVENLKKQGYVKGELLKSATDNAKKIRDEYYKVNQQFNLLEANRNLEDYNNRKKNNQEKKQEAKDDTLYLLESANELYNKQEQAKKDYNDIIKGFSEQEYLDQYNANLKKIELDKKAAEDSKAIKQAELQAKQELENAYLDSIGAGIGILKMFSEKNKGLQKASLIAENALTIARIILDTQKANAAVTAKYALIPGGQAISAAEILTNKIKAGIGIATSIAATAKGLQGIGAGGGAGGNNPNLGNTPNTTSPIQPQLGQTALNQQLINQTGNASVRAFVLETDVSGNQERIRRLNRAARIN
jgi:hypothetical protein